MPTSVRSQVCPQVLPAPSSWQRCRAVDCLKDRDGGQGVCRERTRYPSKGRPPFLSSRHPPVHLKRISRPYPSVGQQGTQGGTGSPNGPGRISPPPSLSLHISRDRVGPNGFEGPLMSKFQNLKECLFRYNSFTLYLSHLKYNSMTFGIFAYTCNYHYSPF